MKCGGESLSCLFRASEAETRQKHTEQQGGRMEEEREEGRQPAGEQDNGAKIWSARRWRLRCLPHRRLQISSSDAIPLASVVVVTQTMR